jgi:hypothetical protein
MSVMYEEEPKCASPGCGHGEARHTANEVPRGHCEWGIGLTAMAMGPSGAYTLPAPRCSCRLFRLQLQPGEKL